MQSSDEQEKLFPVEMGSYCCCVNYWQNPVWSMCAILFFMFIIPKQFFESILH